MPKGRRRLRRELGGLFVLVRVFLGMRVCTMGFGTNLGCGVAGRRIGLHP
jgi:hypothetical protein